MELYELVLNGEDEKLVETTEPLDIGWAVAISDEVWLVLRKSERAALHARARFECRRALSLHDKAREVIDYAKALELDLVHAREVPRDRAS
jgi:glutathione synthase/RimK-type ligase-like ATP-grasp enzyme